MIDKILYYILAFTLGFVIMFCTLVIQKKDNQINQLKKEVVSLNMIRELQDDLLKNKCGIQ